MTQSKDSLEKNLKKSGNITLIGMPSSGKSSIGLILAKRLGKEFIDTDILICEKYNKSLKDLIMEYGDEKFRQIEEEINEKLVADNAVIAPGGSVIYGKRAMDHLKNISTVVYLELSYNAVRSRIGDLRERGVSLSKGQTLRTLYNERVPLYKKYADITVNEMKKSINKVVAEICEKI